MHYGKIPLLNDLEGVYVDWQKSQRDLSHLSGIPFMDEISTNNRLVLHLRQLHQYGNFGF